MLDMLNKALTALLRDELSSQNIEFFRRQDDGLDPTTGIYYELKDETHLVRREDNAADNFFQLELSRLNSYSLNLEQQDWTYYGYSVGAGNNNSINIIQRTY